MKAKKGYKCKRCRQMQTAHSICNSEGEPFFMCASGDRSPGFERFVTKADRAGNSFYIDDAVLLDEILTRVLTGQSIDHLRRHKRLPKLAGKIKRMAQKLKARSGGTA